MARLTTLGWLAIVALGAMLGAGLWLLRWNGMDGAGIPTAGIVAFVLGAVFSMALGAGIMALLFWTRKQ